MSGGRLALSGIGKSVASNAYELYRIPYKPHYHYYYSYCAIVTDTTDTDITTAAEEIQLLLQFMRDKSTKKLHSEKYREKAASKLAAQAAAGTGSGVTDPKRAAAAVQRGKDKDSMPPSLLHMCDEGWVLHLQHTHCFYCI